MIEELIEDWQLKNQQLAKFLGVEVKATGQQERDLHCRVGKWLPLILISKGNDVHVATFKIDKVGQIIDDDQTFNEVSLTNKAAELIPKIAALLWANRETIKLRVTF